MRKDHRVYPSRGWFVWTTCFYNSSKSVLELTVCVGGDKNWQSLLSNCKVHYLFPIVCWFSVFSSTTLTACSTDTHLIVLKLVPSPLLLSILYHITTITC